MVFYTFPFKHSCSILCIYYVPLESPQSVPISLHKHTNCLLHTVFHTLSYTHTHTHTHSHTHTHTHTQSQTHPQTHTRTHRHTHTHTNLMEQTFTLHQAHKPQAKEAN